MLCIIIYYAARFPEKFKEVEEEVFSNFKSPDDVEHKDINKLEKLQCFFKECMRLNSSVP
jgi:hypothetical protein